MASSTRATQNQLRDKIQMSMNGHERRAENRTHPWQDSARGTVIRRQANSKPG